MADTPHYYYAHGRRKESVATVRLFAGPGEITVADQPAEQYFNNATLTARLQEPLKLVGQDTKLSATLRLTGGGKTGQADAARLAISRALFGARRRAAPDPQEGWPAHPRLPREGTQEVRPQARPQGPAV